MTRVAQFMAHALPTVLVMAVASRILYWLGYLSLTVTGVAFDILLVFWFTCLVHIRRQTRLCLRCIKTAPLDPENQVRTRKWLLCVEHFPIRLDLYILAITMAISVGGIEIFIYNSAPYRLADIPLDTWVLGSIYATWTHHRLRPWCPYCKGWDDGGDEELVPDPDPAEGRVLK
jgi:hypothetical protein